MNTDPLGTLSPAATLVLTRDSKQTTTPTAAVAWQRHEEAVILASALFALELMPAG